MSFKQIGFNFSSFSPKSKKIIIDIDADELRKNTITIDMPIIADLRDVIPALNEFIHDELPKKENWLAYCNKLKKHFDYSFENYKITNGINPYLFMDKFMLKLHENSVVVVGNSCACISLLQKGIVKKNQRIFGNVNCGTMGYDLPASIGACLAHKSSVICLTGDGSFQMNLQEIQTIVHNKLPIKIIVFNNFGYQAIVQTQNNFFDGVLSGCTPDSGVSMPDFEKIATAYGIPYSKIEKHDELEQGIDWLLEQKSYALCEVTQDRNQSIQPRIKSKKMTNGQLISPPIDDLFPFLEEREYEKYAKN